MFEFCVELKRELDATQRYRVVLTRDGDQYVDLEDRVDLGCNVCVAGAVTIGHDSRIGANTLVIADLPPGSVAVGVPAQILRRLSLPAPEGEGDPP